MTAASTDCVDQLLLADFRRLAQAAQRTAAWTAAVLGDALGSRPRGEFGILMYHRITDPVKNHPMPTWNVTPRRFREQLAGLLKRGFEAWPLRKVLEYHRRKLALPKRVFVVTFDDGYVNNLTHALPVLEELKVPATIFLATGFIGSSDPMPFDDWSSKAASEVPAESWRALTLDECRRLQASPLIELAAHTHTHQDFRGRPDDFRRDLRQCRAFLREELGIDEPTFAFPFGTVRLGYTGPELTNIVRELGFPCSLTTEDELCRIDATPFQWGRFTAEQHDTAATLAGKLSGWFGMLRGAVRRVKRMAMLPGAAGPIASAAGSQ